MVVKISKIWDVVSVLIVLAAALWLLRLVAMVFLYATFSVPTESMCPTLLPGDRVWVNKLTYGARIFDVTDSVCHGSVRRLPGLSSPKRNDVVVFNNPFPNGGKRMSFHLLKYYVKRCVALPGDTFEIRRGRYSVRGCSETLGLAEAQRMVEICTRDSVSLAESHVQLGAFPRRRFIPWTVREFGPFYVPKAGDTIAINRDNVLLYGSVIEWELGEPIENQGDTAFFAGGRKLERHVMSQGCYFMAGDNAPYSQDSRYWGLVPEEFIVGRVSMTHYSVCPVTGNWRWERLMKDVR